MVINSVIFLFWPIVLLVRWQYFLLVDVYTIYSFHFYLDTANDAAVDAHPSTSAAPTLNVAPTTTTTTATQSTSSTSAIASIP